MQAKWNEVVIAESDHTINVEGNQYFPPDTVKMKYLKSTDTHTVCHWKGEASYYSVFVKGEENPDAAWYYPKTSKMAEHIKGYVAFWKGVEVVK